MIDASWRLEVPMSAMDGTEDSAKAEARHSKARLGYPFASAPEAGATLDVAPGVKWVRMPLPFALQWNRLCTTRQSPKPF
jgi:hypothetical protein